MTYLFDIPCVGEELAIGGLELMGARLEHFRKDVRSFLQCKSS
jgi:hypothetical protein